MTLTVEQLNELKEDLLTMKQNLADHETTGSPVDDDIDELSVADNHLADSATEFVDRQQQIAENNLHEQRINDVNEALERMEEGTYGICVDTGKEIPFERLKAIPYAKRTVEAEEEHQDQSPANSDEDTTRLLKPKGEMEDSRRRTLDRIEEEHNSVEKPDDKARFNKEPNDETKW